MRVFIDVNVFMDFVLGRTPFYSDATQIMTMAMHKDIECATSPNSFPFVFHHYQKDFKSSSPKDLKHRLAIIRKYVHCQTLDGKVIDAALSLKKPLDLEDGVITRLAIDFKADVLISRDKSLLKTLLIKAMTPKQFLAWWEYPPG